MEEYIEFLNVSTLDLLFDDLFALSAEKSSKKNIDKSENPYFYSFFLLYNLRKLSFVLNDTKNFFNKDKILSEEDIFFDEDEFDFDEEESDFTDDDYEFEKNKIFDFPLNLEMTDVDDTYFYNKSQEFIENYLSFSSKEKKEFLEDIVNKNDNWDYSETYPYYLQFENFIENYINYFESEVEPKNKYDRFLKKIIIAELGFLLYKTDKFIENYSYLLLKNEIENINEFKMFERYIFVSLYKLQVDLEEDEDDKINYELELSKLYEFSNKIFDNDLLKIFLYTLISDLYLIIGNSKQALFAKEKSVYYIKKHFKFIYERIMNEYWQKGKKRKLDRFLLFYDLMHKNYFIEEEIPVICEEKKFCFFEDTEDIKKLTIKDLEEHLSEGFGSIYIYYLIAEKYLDKNKKFNYYLNLLRANKEILYFFEDIFFEIADLYQENESYQKADIYYNLVMSDFDGFMGDEFF